MNFNRFFSSFSLEFGVQFAIWILVGMLIHFSCPVLFFVVLNGNTK